MKLFLLLLKCFGEKKNETRARVKSKIVVASKHGNGVAFILSFDIIQTTIDHLFAISVIIYAEWWTHTHNPIFDLIIIFFHVNWIKVVSHFCVKFILQLCDVLSPAFVYFYFWLEFMKGISLWLCDGVFTKFCCTYAQITCSTSYSASVSLD